MQQFGLVLLAATTTTVLFRRRWLLLLLLYCINCQPRLQLYRVVGRCFLNSSALSLSYIYIVSKLWREWDESGPNYYCIASSYVFIVSIFYHLPLHMPLLFCIYLWGLPLLALMLTLHSVTFNSYGSEIDEDLDCFCFGLTHLVEKWFGGV